MTETIKFKSCPHFDLNETLHCGQAFRWSEPDESGAFYGIIAGHKLNVYFDGDSLCACGENISDIKDKIYSYFDLDLDYEKIKNLLCNDKILSEAVIFAPGIRILKQDPWEALGSFIFSSNNHITRISGIIDRFCQLYGKEAVGGGYDFPDYERVSRLNKADLAPLRCGYRDEYILDAARKLTSGEVDLDIICSADIDTARKELMKIKGVGPKVAECVLLFGFHRLEAFPVDVHIKRALEFFPDGLPEYALPYAGIAQQYLFHWMRLKSLSGVR